MCVSQYGISAGVVKQTRTGDTFRFHRIRALGKGRMISDGVATGYPSGRK